VSYLKSILIRASMNIILSILLINFTSLSLFAATESSYGPAGDELIRVLILSGKNNHNWQKTTPLLIRIFKDSQLFTTQITEVPDTLSYDDLKRYDLVVSNWNSWPDNNLRFSNNWESDFLRYVNEGGGALFFHAGASSFYDWDAYHRVGIGRWGKDTRHGVPTIGRVYGFDQSHPVTEGMRDFYIMDEIWENTDIYPEAKVIGSMSAKDKKDGHLIDVPSVFVNETGKGRSFYTILGHDERALLNTGLQTLLLRAGQWCTGRKVTIKLPPELKETKSRSKDKLNWNETDSTLTLCNHSGIIWQLNYNNRFGKPYFHPLAANHTILTCVSPSDHPWHLGLWFSWKFINGINYWEYMSTLNSPETGYKSEGITEIEKKEITCNTDFSANIYMKLNYHPINGNPVLAEDRNLHISSLFSDGSYFIDEEHTFNALSDSVILDRTPISGEQGGQSWGGYAGLSIRYNQDFTSPEILTTFNSANCRKCNWLYMGFNSLTGERTGISILLHPEFTTSSASWYVIEDQNIPFYYFSPAVLFDHKIILRKGEILHLKYRIWILPGVYTKEKIQEKFDQYVNKM
jgi:type 1 glutamine amidotransferase